MYSQPCSPNFWIRMVQVLAVDEEGGPDVGVPEGVQHDLGAVVGAVVEGQVEHGVVVPGLVAGHGLGVVGAVHRLRPVALVRLCLKH